MFVVSERRMLSTLNPENNSYELKRNRLQKESRFNSKTTEFAGHVAIVPRFSEHLESSVLPDDMK